MSQNDEPAPAEQVDTERLDEFIEQLGSVEPLDAELEVRDLAKREIGMRIVPWEIPAVTRDGPEVIMRGAFDGVDASKVILQLEHENPPAGRGIEYENRSDGGYMTFRVSRTQRGDDILTLASDGVTTGVSVSFQDVPGGTELYTRSGKKLRVVHRANLRAVSTTWRPTWQDAAIQFVRTAPEGETPMPDVPVNDTPETPAAPVLDIEPINAALSTMGQSLERSLSGFTERLEKIEERNRKDFVIPAHEATPTARARRGDWVQTVLSVLSGQRVNDIQMRSLEDLITTDNIGVVPDAFLTELTGVIDPSRPFLGSIRRLDLPSSGMSLVVPKIVTRPTVGIQANGSGTPAEKAEIVSTATEISTDTFDAVTIAGGGDISLQLLRRSSPSFLSLYLELLAEAYAQNAEAEGISALLAAGPESGGTLDPEALTLGEAWANGAAVRKPPNTIWLSTAAVGAFIDAKADGSNMPLYSSIQAGFTAASGTGGTISGLRPIHVPALDASGVDVIVGPSSGMGYTEDGTFTLQVDVPAKAGRDVALVGILWFAPLYPDAFTTYTIGS